MMFGVNQAQIPQAEAVIEVKATVCEMVCKIKILPFLGGNAQNEDCNKILVTLIYLKSLGDNKCIALQHRNIRKPSKVQVIIPNSPIR